jgi:DNA repair protein RadA/Sms
MPRRMTTGVDHNRVAILTAIIEKRAGFRLQGEDIFVNVAGGVKINEPATDLGIVVAIASSFKNRPIDSHIIIIGEVGLGGEVRRVPQIDTRIGEGIKLGFTRCIIPKNQSRSEGYADSIDIVEARTIGDAFEILFN